MQSPAQESGGQAGATSRTEASPGSGIRRADLVLFALYLLLYAGFMVLTAFAPDTMAIRVVGGVNLAIAYGMGLILAAILLAGVATVMRHGAADEGSGR